MATSSLARSQRRVEDPELLPAHFMPRVSWRCLTACSALAGWGHCMPVPGCSGCWWGWRWPGSWHTSCCPAPPRGWQRWHGPSSCSAPGERDHSWTTTQALPDPLLVLGAGRGQRRSTSPALRVPSKGGGCWWYSVCEAPLLRDNFPPRKQTLPSLCPCCWPSLPGSAALCSETS